MRPEGVAAASRELKRTIRAQKRLLAADSTEDAEDAWVDLLVHAGRVYEKLRAACHGHPLDWTWWKRKMDQRSEDPLLLYLHKARNADTHRLENITEHVPAGAHISGYGSVAHDGPQHLRPLSVRDKEGNLYEPPLRHRGRVFGYLDVATIGWMASMYLQELVSEASSRLR